MLVPIPTYQDGRIPEECELSFYLGVGNPLAGSVPPRIYVRNDLSITLKLLWGPWGV